MKVRVFLMLLVFGFMSGCSSEDNAEPVDSSSDDVSINPLDSLDIVVAPDIEEEPDVEVNEEVNDADEGDGYVAPEFACTETIQGGLPSGVGIIYSCLSTAEGLPYQAIRQYESSSDTVRSRALVENPERLGIQLGTRDGWGYYDTAVIENDQVSARRIYRFDLVEGEAELVREFTTTDFAQVGFDIQFSQTSQSLLFLLQPGGTRIAFQMVDPVTKVGQGSVYVFDEADESVLDTITLGQEGTVRRFSWNLDGTQLLFTAGGSLFFSGADLSGASSKDSAVMSSPAAPRQVRNDLYVYAGKKTQVRIMTEYADGEVFKEDLPEVFTYPIEELHAMDEDTIIVVAKDVYGLNVVNGEVSSLGALPGFGNHPFAVSPDGTGYIAGGSIENPFRSFEYHYTGLNGENPAVLIGTEKGAGYVSNSLAWY